MSAPSKPPTRKRQNVSQSGAQSKRNAVSDPLKPDALKSDPRAADESSTEAVNLAATRQIALLQHFIEFIVAIMMKTFASQPKLQERLRGALALLRAEPKSSFTEHELYLLRVAELLVLSCIKPQLDRVVEQFSPAIRQLFQPAVSLEEFSKRSGPHMALFKDALKKKVMFWRGRECFVLIDYLRRLSILVTDSNIPLACLKTLVTEQIRHDDVPIVLRDLYLVEKFARAVLVQRIIELQMMIGGATATSWLSASQAPDIRERKEVEKNTLLLLRKVLRNVGCQTDFPGDAPGVDAPGEDARVSGDAVTVSMQVAALTQAKPGPAPSEGDLSRSRSSQSPTV